MKISEIVTEDFDPYKTYDLSYPDSKEVNKVNSIRELVNIIENNCGQMLSAYRKSKKVLYRGVKDAPKTAHYDHDSDTIITAIRPDRKALTLRQDQHDDLEKLFNSAGLKANRTNSIFCTSNPIYAGAWGTIFAIFVKDGWEGTVFESVKRDYSYYALKNIIQSNMTSDKEKLEQFNNLKPMSVTPQNLSEVLNNGYEDILITGSSYIGIRNSSNALESALKLLGVR